MIPTDKAMEIMERVRWTPDPETQAALNFIIQILSLPEGDGFSKLDRIYLNCNYEEQRNREVETAAFAFLHKRFKREYAVFTADCAQDGRARFKLRIADTHADLAKCVPATSEVFINLMRPVEEWVAPPKTELRLVQKVNSAPVGKPLEPAKASSKPTPTPPRATPPSRRRTLT